MKRIKFLLDHNAYGHTAGEEASFADPVADMLVKRGYARHAPVKTKKKAKEPTTDQK